MVCVLVRGCFDLFHCHDCGMYREVVSLVRATDKLQRPITGIRPNKRSLIIESGVIILV
jgi:hypothetical protein